jgi:hypothetical protein
VAKSVAHESEASSPQSQPDHVEPAKPLFEPLQDDEVAAFKRALASGTPAPAAGVGEIVSSGPRNPHPMPQFQDTEIDEMPLPLSTTQYGELK